MTFEKDIEALHADGYERSVNEHRNFTEVFSGNGQRKTSKKCVVTGAIKFEGNVNSLKETSGSGFFPNEHVLSTTKKCVNTGAIKFEGSESKPRDALLSPYSETSVVSSQLNSSNRNFLKETSGPGFSPNGHGLSTTKKCVVTGAINFEGNKGNKSKAINALLPPNGETSVISSDLSVNNINCLMETSGLHFSSNKHASSANDNVTNGQRLNPSLEKPSVSNSVTFHLVESTSQGITSSCYLLRGDVFRHSFSDNNKNNVTRSTTISSPVSQESSANKSLPFGIHGERTTESKVNGSSNKTSQCKYSTKDPRPLLRNYIQDLLRGSGWEIRKRERADKVSGEYVYSTPHTRRLIREFHKAWNLCGQSLSIDRDSLLLEDGKEWNNMTSFWSDLSLTVRKIDNEPSLAQWWCLLDPFVNVVFIEKKLNMLKAGEVVRAKSSLMVDLNVNGGSVTSSKNINRIGKKSQKGSSDGHCRSSPVGRNEVTATEANNPVCNDNRSNNITVDLGISSKGQVKPLNRVVAPLSEEKCTFSGTSDGLDPYYLQVSGSNGNSDHSSCCLNEVLTTPQNGLVALSEYVPRPKGVPSSAVDPEPVKENANLKTPQAQNRDGRKRSADCEIEDNNDLLISLVHKKTSRSRARSSIGKIKPRKPKPLKKSKTHKSSCRLLARSLDKGGKHNEEKWFVSGPRTVLSWLINCGLISLGEVIRFWNSKEGGVVVKEGLIAKDGIFCKCCDEVVSISKFKSHSGFMLSHPLLNLEMGYGKPFTLFQLEAWSDEYRARKNAILPVEVEDLDQNDDSCGLCGGGGELICCDNCPSTFHQKCLPEQEFPEGDWYCQHCSCRICGVLVDDKEGLISTGALKCLQCDHKYHEACLKEKFASLAVASGGRFCGETCQEIYSGLQSRVGVLNYLPDGISWALLKCIHEDQTNDSTQRIALKAECNSKLAVALTIMEECFLPMVDARTGINMIPHVVYNMGSEFSRLNYHGFYSMVLEKDDVLISVASIRVHGVTVAEMPLIATCSKYRRQGMCRRLMNSIEEFLISLKVEMLVITAIPDVVETWTVGFGFEPLEDYERKSLSHINLMVFPGTIWLKKTMYKAPTGDDEMDVSKTSYDERGSVDTSFEAKLSKAPPGEELISELGNETVSNLDSVTMKDERKFQKCPMK